MCGRMSVHDHASVQGFLDELGLSLDAAHFTPRYNLAPSDPVHALFRSNGLDIAQMHWGFPPARPGQRGLLINARAESIWSRPTFRDSARTRRVVLPVNGFYEWQRSGGERLPYYIDARDRPILALAGIHGVDAQGLMRCCVITTAANDDLRELHDRMPVVLAPQSVRDWLETDRRSRLDELMQPAPARALRLCRVSRFVNNSRNDGPECMAPLVA